MAACTGHYPCPLHCEVDTLVEHFDFPDRVARFMCFASTNARRAMPRHRGVGMNRAKKKKVEEVEPASDEGEDAGEESEPEPPTAEEPEPSIPSDGSESAFEPDPAYTWEGLMAQAEEAKHQYKCTWSLTGAGARRSSPTSTRTARCAGQPRASCSASSSACSTRIPCAIGLWEAYL